MGRCWGWRRVGEGSVDGVGRADARVGKGRGRGGEWGSTAADGGHRLERDGGVAAGVSLKLFGGGGKGVSRCGRRFGAARLTRTIRTRWRGGRCVLRVVRA